MTYYHICTSCERRVMFTGEQLSRGAVLTCTCGHKLDLSALRDEPVPTANLKESQASVNAQQRAQRG